MIGIVRNKSNLVKSACRIFFAVFFFFFITPVQAFMDSTLFQKGYRVRELSLKPDYDGNPIAVLIYKNCGEPSQKAVLYIHGYNDYFFQDHMADWYIDHGYNFYALELRRYGRALMPGQVRYGVKRLTDYYEELDQAIGIIRNGHGNSFLLLNGHSTGGLVVSLYASDRTSSQTIDAIFLNSPFFELNAGWFSRNILSPIFGALGGIFPNLKLPVPSSPYYSESLHILYRGEWDYDLSLKLLENKIRCGWLRAIRKGQKRIKKGLNITCPVLVMHSDKSGNENRWNDQIPIADVVLNVKDIKRLSTSIGTHITLKEIAKAKHDVILSLPDVRQDAFNELGKWLEELSQ